MKEFLTEDREKELLRMLFREEPCSKDGISVLFRDFDMDHEKMEYLLMLALLGYKKGWQYFPDEVKPRLEGVYKSARIRNIYGIPWLRDKLVLLKKQGVPVMFLKGMAMRAFFAPDIPRQMSDFDLAVPEDRFKEAKEILTSSGENTRTGTVSLHAIHITEGQRKVIDLHQWVFKTHGDKRAAIWEKSISADFDGMDIRVLNPVDMFIHIVDCKSRDIIKDLQAERKTKWLLDARLIIEKAGCKNWKWEEVADRAKELGSLNYLSFLLQAFSEVFPDILSPNDVQKIFPKDDKYRNWHKRVSEFSRKQKQYREYLRNRNASEEHKLKDSFKSLHYAWTSYRFYYGPELKAASPEYGFIKYFCETRHVNGIPALLKRYLTRLFVPEKK